MKGHIIAILVLVGIASGGISPVYRSQPRRKGTKVTVRNNSPFPITNITVEHWYGWEPDCHEIHEWGRIDSAKTSAVEKPITFATGELKTDQWKISWGDVDGYIACSTDLEDSASWGFRVHQLRTEDRDRTVVVSVNAYTVESLESGDHREGTDKLVIHSVDNGKPFAFDKVAVDFTYTIGLARGDATGGFQCKWLKHSRG